MLPETADGLLITALANVPGEVPLTGHKSTHTHTRLLAAEPVHATRKVTFLEA
jgi:hypothetical protein